MVTVPLRNEAKTVQETGIAAFQKGAATVNAETGTAENLYLIGRPTLNQFLRFVKEHAVHAPGPGDLVEEWQAANAVVRRLEKEEGGLADDPEIEPADVENELLLEFVRDPLVRGSFNTVPTEVAYIELDSLVVYQHHIDLTFVEELKNKLGPSPGQDEIFRTCLPCGKRPLPPVRWSRARRGSFVFLSPSNDLRFLGHMQMREENIKDYPPPGSLAGVLGLAVGFGTNFLNAIHIENRLILNNGSHRAYALRDLGVTHVPCIIQHVSSRDELDVLGATAVTEDADFYLKASRPMMLKDYFDLRLRKVMSVHRRLKQITVKFEVEEADVPTF